MMDFSNLLKMYACNSCNNMLAREQDRITGQKFNGAYGPAFLFHKVFGIESGEPFEMEMTTGYHTVQRVSCAGCKQEMGYLYVKAPNPEQEYKLGKYLVDTTLLSTILVQASTAQAFNAKL